MPTANSSRCQPQIHLEAGRNLPERTVRGEYRIRAHVPGCLAGLLHKAKDFPHQPSDHLYLCPHGRIPDPHEFALSVMLNVKAGGICKDFMTTQLTFAIWHLMPPSVALDLVEQEFVGIFAKLPRILPCNFNQCSFWMMM